MTSLLARPHYQSGVIGRKVTYPVPITQAEALGEFLMTYGREIEWEFTPRNSDTELLHVTATREVHLKIFEMAYLTRQAKSRIGRDLGIFAA